MSTGRTTARDFPRATGQGLAAFADGVVPFGDPLSNYYGDGSVVGWEAGYVGGAMTQEAAWLASGGQAVRLTKFGFSGRAAYLFGKANPKGILNRGKYVRIGWNWRGSRKAGDNIFRIGLGGRDAPSWFRGHIDFW